ncbi:RHS repeat domain-containing protein [Terrimonas rubra]|uniref:RHS repeat domain-containing protein n=1 Tax=Terrimonas rubra TaxID=1035890 RepID=A0ABW6A5Q9_9BACT
MYKSYIQHIGIFFKSNNLFKGLNNIICFFFFSFIALADIAVGQNTVLKDGGVQTVVKKTMFGPTAVPSSDIVAWGSGASLSNIPVRQTEYSRKFKNIISFFIAEENTIDYLNDFVASVDLVINYKASQSDVAYKTFTKTLTIDYKKGEGQLSDVRQYIHFEGAENVEVVVTPNFPSGGPDYRNILVLTNEIQVTRYFTLSNTPFTFLHPLNVPSASSTLPSGSDVLNVAWSFPSNPGNSAIQLEWSWLENELESNYHIGGSFTTGSKEKLLSSGATRVELGNAVTNYSIPMLYDGDGKIHYRVRGINMLYDGSRLFGPWSTIQSISFGGHANDLNWQATNVFAEEGKHKTVIQYFDGSFRGRQTVTRDNTTQLTVTAETLYDREGRPAVQVLAAPGINNVIAYRANLNKFNSPDGGPIQTDNEDHSLFFDYQTTVGPNTPSLQTNEGSASAYYSPANPDKSGVNKYIPDAEGYPYSLTRYTQDGTGRIAAQSSVGAPLQMGSGKEMKFFYGAPTQEELDALFGTEVGDRSHYFKNMVKDANGQMTVSYVDNLGRTIATALAGGPPSGLNSLNVTDNNDYFNQYHTSSVTFNLLDANTNRVKGNVIESVSTLLVPASTNYEFTYTLTPGSLEVNTCELGGQGSISSPICYECLYDLEFSIFDESGSATVPVMVKKFSNLSVTPDYECSTPARLFQDSANLSSGRPSAISFSELLLAGSYSVRKTLSLSEKSMQAFTEDFLTKGVCTLSLDLLIDSVFQELKQVTDCDAPPLSPEASLAASCTSCIADLGTPSTFQTTYLQRIGYTEPGELPDYLKAEIETAYKNAEAVCNLMCGETALQTVNKRQLMLADMMPFTGQYAKSEVGTGTMSRKYNIFSTYSATPPFYKNPRKLNGDPGGFYLDIRGEKDLLIHTTPAILNDMSVEEFEFRFQNEWAASLLPYHPEYQRLLFVEENMEESYIWANKFFRTRLYNDASTEGYLFENATQLAAKDDFFAIPTAADEKNIMEGWLTTEYKGGLNLWQFAYFQAICTRLPMGASCFKPSGPSAFSSLPAADRDSVWKKFKGLYLQARIELMDRYIVRMRPLPASDENDLVAQHFILRFPRDHQQQVTQYGNNSEDPDGWNFWPSTPSPDGRPNLPPDWDTPAAMQQEYTERCQGYITQWKNSLLQCPQLAGHPDKNTIITSITSQMVEVCRKGSNEANPYGASTVAPATPVDASPRSFEEIINQVFTTYGIAKTDVCNPFVIEYPKPYGAGRPVIGPVVTAIDSCNCSRFNTIKSEAVIAGKNPNELNSLNEYLSQQYGDTLTTGLFAALNRCNEIGTQYTINCEQQYTEVYYECHLPGPVCDLPFNARAAGVDTTMVLKMDGNGKVSLVEQPCDGPGGPIGEIDPDPWNPGGGGNCCNGMVWDSYLGTCVWPPMCGPNEVYNYNTGMCVPVVPCEIGYEYVPGVGCVPIAEPLCSGLCPDGMLCDTVTVDRVYLTAGEPMPAFMQCGYTNVDKCLTCSQVKNLIDEYKSIFPALPYNVAPVLDADNLDIDQVQYNKSFARFMNFRTGFSYTWSDYLQAIQIAGCEVTAGGSQVVICQKDKPLTDAGDRFSLEDPCQQTYEKAVAIATQLYKFRLQWMRVNFEKRYREKCLDAGKDETFTVKFIPQEYHYTLYYYDQAGNLVKTVPPAGVKPDYSTEYLADVKLKRQTVGERVPEHNLLTQYRYNSLNQVVAQISPDAGISEFWYDKLARLVVSQSAVQRVNDKYSYTLYDELGRIKEIGQKQHLYDIMTQGTSQDPVELDAWINSSGTRDQLTQTVYDQDYTLTIADPALSGKIMQRNLRNRVSYSLVKNFSTDTWYTHATFYTYDIHGNVDKLLQDFRGVVGLPATSRFKQVTYDYDLISSKVRMVAYQAGEADAFYHRYSYDLDDRIMKLETSRDKVYWEQDAAYNYYKHGALSRIVLGQQLVQGNDYAYTLQGWLKGVNSSNLTTGTDMGGDGHTVAPNNVVARDVLGYTLNYYDNGTNLDYRPIGSSTAFAQVNTLGGDLKSLYNGNIAAITVNNKALVKGGSGINAISLLYNYGYDQLNRLVSMRAFNGLNVSTNTWAPSLLNDYQENITYDPNGNIKNYVRNGAPSVGKPVTMDNLGYNYNAGTNQLNYVTDNVSVTNYTEDIDGQSADNYEYDESGNLIKDVSENISSINWTVYGKIADITKSGNTTSYIYDAAGNRIAKTVSGKTTLYVRDGSGNVMSIYEIPSVNTVTQKEIHLYGANRFGMALPESRASSSLDLASGFGKAVTRTLVRGEKIFELSNHLGNVLATISDKKIQVAKSSPNQHQIDYYETDVVSATDYAPFGMQLVGRVYAAPSGKYRYGFHGKENDNEIKGDGNQQDYGMRVYDNRLGRFLSVDPLAHEYHDLSPFHFAGANPIKNVDLDGGEPKDYRKNLVFMNMSTVGKSLGKGYNEYNKYDGVAYVEAVYDKVTSKYWFIHRQGGRNYYWKHNPGADQMVRLVSDVPGKSNGHWAPYTSAEDLRAKTGQDLAKGLATFWSVTLGGTLAFGPAFIHAVAVAFVEDALGVPLINSPDDIVRTQQKTSVKKVLTKSDLFEDFSKRMGSSVDNLAGKMDISDDGTLYLSIDAILKKLDGPSNDTFKKLTEIAEQMGKEQGAHSVQINFNLVVNHRLANDPTWAQEYGYYFTKQVDSNFGYITVTWDKSIE